MTIHKEGYPTIILTLIVVTILNVVAYYFFNEYAFLRYLVYAISLFLIVIVLQFFRSPSRVISTDENKVVAPCDGKVVVIEEIEETEYLNEKRIQLSIFMSPLNVHNNRYPIGGKLKYYKYHPGNFWWLGIQNHLQKMKELLQ